MNRLAVRLALAMIAVAILTALIIVASQQVGFMLDFRSLPPEVQQRLQERRELRERVEEARGSDLAANFRRTRAVQERSIIAGTSIAAILAAIIAVFYARNISKPIERVSLASARVAQGDLSIRISESPAYSSLEARTLSNNFNHMASALEGYETERRDMIASIAHDLRTPLTAMQLRLEALKEELVPLNQDEVNLLLSQTELLERLITDLRTLSLADAGKLSLQKQESNIFRLIEDVIHSYKPEADVKHIRLQLEGSEDIYAQVDPARLKQILGNLMDNALRVSPEKSTVLIDLQEAQHEVSITIQDEGPGIPEKLVPGIFDRYMKDKDTGGSSGLGLAIVKTLVELHGGEVKAKNTAQGAVFEITLPKAV